MLNIDIKTYGNKKDNISEDEFRTFFNNHLHKIYMSGTAHSIYDAWADTKYMAINGVNNTVWINCGIAVVKRKLTENTKLLTKSFMEMLIRNYENKLNDVHIEIEVSDDSERYYEISND